MKTANTLGNVSTLVKQLENATTVHGTVAKPSFGQADLWSIQRNRRVRSVRKIIFN